MTFSERMYNAFIYIALVIAPGYVPPVTDIAKYTSNKPPITADQLVSKASFHLVTTDFLIDYPRPSLPHVAFVGGTSTKPSKPLSERFQTFVDSSQYGAVIVSFGSGCAGFLHERIDTFVEAFKRRIDLNFVVKYGVSEYIDGNIMFTPWIPQNDLLGHPKTVAFMTHCGNNGQFEALYHGIPMIGIPLCCDQFYNCNRMRQKGYGVVLDFCLFTVNDIMKALLDVTTQKNYVINIKNASTIFRGRSESPLQRASYWVDHIARFGDKFVHSYSVDMPCYRLIDESWCVFCSVMEAAIVVRVRMYGE
ncbi:UDP-glucuronosyltransferase 1-7-like [Mizuhopecten yessoensis]|uniref:UDP-glucuronosyltransferase 1-7-like n=1 Tax=Mizuhopecten yessoensis TaxID=6573 RepID=UPI000B45BFC9|nr:UDP-glucuronosyltransferase 1-7-like [Mizuhopecten yessoensis]